MRLAAPVLRTNAANRASDFLANFIPVFWGSLLRREAISQRTVVQNRTSCDNGKSVPRRFEADASNPYGEILTMSVKLVFTAPASVKDSLDNAVKDAGVLAALADLSCLEGTVLDHLSAEIDDAKTWRGGFLRIAFSETGAPIQVIIDIESPRELTKQELKLLREDLDGQVSDGIGEGAFDFLSEAADLTIETYPPGCRKSMLVQSDGNAWMPKNRATEAKLNRERCKRAAEAMKQCEAAVTAKASPKSGKGTAQRDIKNLMKLLILSDSHRRPKDIVRKIGAEIASLGGDLSFIKSKKLPFVNFRTENILILLLEARLNPNLLDQEGQSLLWLSTWNVKSLAALLERGADVNIVNDDVFKETALIRASWTHEIESVRFLLERGANPRIRTFFGGTALDKAKENASSNPENAKAVIKLLEDA